jgi:hypothetical protein
MRIYVEIKNRNLSLDYRELAEKMWFKSYRGKDLELSHIGNTSSLNENYRLALKWDKWGNDHRWSTNDAVKSFSDEYISLDPIREKSVMYIETDHVNIVQVDFRALCIMTKELAEAVKGLISDDAMKTWLSLEEFEEKYNTVLHMSFENANDQSLNEVFDMEVIEEPWDNEVKYH